MNKKEWYDSIFDMGIEKKYKKGEVIYTSQDKCHSMGRIETGSVKICRVLPSGKEIILKEIHKGENYAELIIFSDTTYPGWIIANEDVVIKEVSRNVLFKSLENKNNLELFLSGISHKMTTLTDKIELLSFKTVKQKLLYLVTKQNTLSMENINVSNLAVVIGCSREALSRAISSLVSGGIISYSENRIDILNEDLLDRIFN